MFPMFATCARGLEPVLADELRALPAADVEPGRGGVSFAGDLVTLYRANLWLRTAVRVLKPILHAPVRNPDELYDAVRSLDWARYLTPDHTLAVDCNVRDSGITHSHYAALKTKDAICDQFVERVGRRPSVDTEEPMVKFNLHVFRDEMTLSLDSSGESLHKRGYRPALTVAPLNEALAAGLVLRSGWSPAEPLWDPMCGSGVLPIEAAWIALNRPPGLTRKRFNFMGWPDYDVALWAELRDHARAQRRQEANFDPRRVGRAEGRGRLRQRERPDGRRRPRRGVPPGRRARLPAAGRRAGDGRVQPALRRAHRRREGTSAAVPGDRRGVRPVCGVAVLAVLGQRPFGAGRGVANGGADSLLER